MKISWNWLSRYVNLDGIDPFDMYGRFTMAVAELEGMERVGEGLEGVVAVKILDVRPHPNAKKLQLADIDLGQGRTMTLVSGAPNTRVGMVVPFVPVGTKYLGKDGEWHVMEAAELRGVKSEGMLCSQYELGLSDDHSGLWELPPDIEPGTPLVEIAPIHDVIWEIDNKSLTHRPDLWGHIGLAREVAALVGREFDPKIPEIAFTQDDPLSVSIDAPDLCSRYTAYRLSGVKVGPAPLWMQVLLMHVGQRPINNIVDITNFVMLSTANPIHAFDASKIRGNKIIVRRAEEGERMTTLDGREHVLTRDDLVIADAEGPVALAGVMGGADSEVTDDTTEVILESANFHPATIRRTALRLGARTDASARFEKSLDPYGAEDASHLFGQLVLDTVPGAAVTSRYYDVGEFRKEPIVINTSGEFIRRRLGTEMPTDRIVDILSALHFGVERSGDDLTVTVPTFRATKDVSIPEDLVEEVGRIHGYDNIEPKLPSIAMTRPWTLPVKELERLLRRVMAMELGFTEVMTYSFVKTSVLERLERSADDLVELKNPISAEEPYLRPSLVSTMLEVVERNQRDHDHVRVFEYGRVFRKDTPIPEQSRRLGALVSFKKLLKDPDGALYYYIKGAATRLFDRLERGALEIVPITEAGEAASEPWIHPVRSGALRLQGRIVGWISVLHPKALRALELEHGVAFMEVDVNSLAEIPKIVNEFKGLAKFPGVVHDVTVLVDDTVRSSEIAEIIRSVDTDIHIEDVEVFATYRGDRLPAGRKTVSFHIHMRRPDRTITIEEVQAFHGMLEKKLAEKGHEIPRG